MDPKEQRCVIKYLVKKRLSPTEIHADLTATLGDLAVSYDIVKRWCREFKCGRESCEDEHAGGPEIQVTTDENIQKVHNLILQDRRITLRQIVEETGFSYHVVQNITSNILEVKKITARWVPRMLLPLQKRARMDICRQLLDTFRKNKKSFLDRYITMDETWVHHYDPETKLQSKEWRHSGSPPPRKFKAVPSAGKVLASVFWDAEGLLLIDYLEKGATITGNYYAQLIVKLREAVKQKRRGKLRKGVLFHQDNAPVHKSLVAMTAIRDAGFQIVDHPPYSPDLAPSDFQLFPKLKENLRGRKFSSNDAVMFAVNEWFDTVDKSFFSNAIEMLEHRWEKCINMQGDYVEK